jgi:RecA-family ATPase
MHNSLNIENLNNTQLDLIALANDRKQQFTLYCDLAATSTKVWLVKNLLGRGEASAFYGAPGSGKSALVEDMGLHIAAGLPWHGRDVMQGAVCYIALERRLLVERRAIAFRERHGIPDLPFAIMGGVYDFRDPRTAATVSGIVRQVEDVTDQKVILVNIDTVSRALAGGDENSSKDMGAIVNTTSRLQETTGAHVQWVHHIPVDGGERLRGHGALLGALDTPQSPWISPHAPRASMPTASDAVVQDESPRAVRLGNKWKMTACQTPAQSL